MNNNNQSRQQQGQEEQPKETRRFIFPEFEGEMGENYLNAVLRTILPMPLHRTWQICIDYQFDSRAPYIGTNKISKDAGRSLRKIEMDLQEMKRRHLLAECLVQVTRIGGKDLDQPKIMRGKDFTALYNLAHEYHLWTLAPEFGAFEPTFECADFIRQYPQIYKKLIRFECYRRVLENEKPGPKPNLEKYARYDYSDDYSNGYANDEESNTYEYSGGEPSNNRESLGGQERHETQNNADPKRQHRISTPYSLSNITLDTIDSSSNFSFFKNSSPEEPPPNNHPPTSSSPKKPDASYSQTPARERTAPDDYTNSQREQANSNDQANQLLEQLPPKQASGVFSSKQAAKKAEARSERHERYLAWKASQDVIDRCAPVANVYGDLARVKLNDQSERSSLVLLCKIYEASGLQVDDFNQLVYHIVAKAVAVPEKQIRVRDMRGHANRAPLFFSMLEKVIQQGLESIEKKVERDVIESNTTGQEDVIPALHHIKSSSVQDAELPNVQAFERSDVQTLERIEVHDAESSALQQFESLNLQTFTHTEGTRQDDSLEAAPEPDQQAEITNAEIEDAAYRLQRDALNSAKRYIADFVSNTIYLVRESHACGDCGCMIKANEAGRMCCVACSKPREWSAHTCARVDVILRRIPSIEECVQEILATRQGYYKNSSEK